MTAEEFRTRWTGHVPKVQDVTGEYAVLVPLVERPEGLCLLYEVRADTLGRQPGEVCFPGGRLEPGEDAVSCALRETWEELGIPRPAVEVVAELDWLTHQGGFVLYPVLGIVAPEAAERLRHGPAEVKEHELHRQIKVELQSFVREFNFIRKRGMKDSKFFRIKDDDSHFVNLLRS